MKFQDPPSVLTVGNNKANNPKTNTSTVNLQEKVYSFHAQGFFLLFNPFPLHFSSWFKGVYNLGMPVCIKRLSFRKLCKLSPKLNVFQLDSSTLFLQKEITSKIVLVCK